MHDWTYESLIQNLKAALAEAEGPPGPKPVKPTQDDGRGAGVASSTARARPAAPRASLHRHRGGQER